MYRTISSHDRMLLVALGDSTTDNIQSISFRCVPADKACRIVTLMSSQLQSQNLVFGSGH